MGQRRHAEPYARLRFQEPLGAGGTHQAFQQPLAGLGQLPVGTRLRQGHSPTAAGPAWHSGGAKLHVPGDVDRGPLAVGL